MFNSLGLDAGPQATGSAPVVFTSPYRHDRFRDELDLAIQKRRTAPGSVPPREGSPARKKRRVCARRRGSRHSHQRTEGSFLPAGVASLNEAAVNAAIEAQEACTVGTVRQCMLSLGSAPRLSTRLGPDATNTDKLMAFFARVLVNRVNIASPQCRGPKPRGSTEECRCAFAHTVLRRALELSGWRACNFPDRYALFRGRADMVSTCAELLRGGGAAEVHSALEPVLNRIANNEARRLRHKLNPCCSLAMLILGARQGDPVWLWYGHEFVPAQLDSVMHQTEHDVATLRLRVVEPGAAGSGQSLQLAPEDRASLVRGLASTAPHNSALGGVLASRLAQAGAGYALRSFEVRAKYGVPAGALASTKWPGYFAQAFELVEVAEDESDHAGPPIKCALCMPEGAPQQPFRRFFQVYLDPHLRSVRRDWPVELSVIVGSYILGAFAAPYGGARVCGSGDGTGRVRPCSSKRLGSGQGLRPLADLS
eukprot:g76018.t1